MELNALSIVIGVCGMVGLLLLATHIGFWLKNLNRFDRPKYFPRDDDIAWAMVMACPIRIWDYNTISESSMTYDNWDLGILKVDDQALKQRFGMTPRMTDVIIVPRKWGGFWASIVDKELQNGRLRTTFLGEYKSEKVLRRGRDRNNLIYIS